MLLTLKLIFAVLLPTLVGYSVLSFIMKDKDDLFPLERAAYAFGTGSGFIALEMLLLAKIGIHFSLLSIMIPAVLMIAAGVAGSYYFKNTFLDARGLMDSTTSIRKMFEGGKSGRAGWLEMIFGIMILMKLFYIFFEALIKPIIAWDAFAHWAFTARVFYLEKTIPSFLNTIDGANHHILNQFSPLLQTWVFFAIGGWNEIAGKIIFPMFFAALLVIFYFAVRRRSSRLTALIFTFLLSSIPLLTYHATVEYSEILAAFCLFAGAFLTLEFMEKHKRRYLVAAGFMLGLSYFSKNEGLFYSIATIIALVIFLITDSKISARFAAKKLKVAAGIGSLIFFSYIIREMFFAGHEARFLHGVFLDRIPPLISIETTKIFFSGNWNALWMLFILSIPFFILKKDKLPDLYLLLTVLLNFLFLNGYYITAEPMVFDWVKDGTIFSRNLLMFTPLVLLFTARQIELILPKNAIPTSTKNKKAK